jgi:hypothetical protein
MIGYNKMTGYNVARYNADGTEIQIGDTITLTDNTVTKEVSKSVSDFVLMSETIAKQQNKSVTDTIRLNDWLRLKRDDANKWEDQ